MRITNNSFYRFKAVQGDFMELGMGFEPTLDRSNSIWGVIDLSNAEVNTRDRKMVDSYPM